MRASGWRSNCGSIPALSKTASVVAPGAQLCSRASRTICSEIVSLSDIRFPYFGPHLRSSHDEYQARRLCADLIVAPRYEVSVQDYFVFKKVDVKVTGNKGNIESIR
ncbi:hypothetical protein D3C80_1724140 [compost metagenome]